MGRRNGASCRNDRASLAAKDRGRRASRLGCQAGRGAEKAVREGARAAWRPGARPEGVDGIGRHRLEERRRRRARSLGSRSAPRGTQRASHPRDRRCLGEHLHRGSHLPHGGGCAVDRRLQDQPPRGRGPRGLSRQRPRALPRPTRSLCAGPRLGRSRARALFPASLRLEGVARLMELGITLALVSSALLGTAVVLANVGLRHLDPARGALVSIPSTTLLLWLLAPLLYRGEGWNATALAIFAVVGLIFPGGVTLLNFASNRITGPTIAGTVSSTTPLFAVFGAVLFLGE